MLHIQIVAAAEQVGDPVALQEYVGRLR